MKLAVKIIAGFLIAVVLYLGVTFVQVWMASRSDDARPAQAIVVFGTAQYDGRPSPVLRARLEHAIELYRRKLAPVIVVTGGKQPGDRFTEATASANYLLERGIPDESILREVSGTSSWQSLAATAAFLQERNIKRVLLVSDPFHSMRIEAMADELGLEGYASPSHSPIKGLTAARYMAREAAAVAVARFIGYRREAGVHDRVRRAACPAARLCPAPSGVV